MFSAAFSSPASEICCWYVSARSPGFQLTLAVYLRKSAVNLLLSYCTSKPAIVLNRLFILRLLTFSTYLKLSEDRVWTGADHRGDQQHLNESPGRKSLLLTPSHSRLPLQDELLSVVGMTQSTCAASFLGVLCRAAVQPPLSAGGWSARCLPHSWYGWLYSGWGSWVSCLSVSIKTRCSSYCCT